MVKLNTQTEQTKTSGDLRDSNSLAMLLSYVERYERLTEEVDALTDDRKEVMAEAKGVGFDTKILRTVLRRRKMDVADRVEADALLDTYEQAIIQAEKQQLKKSEDEAGD